jgi:hypothetical protein
MERNQSFGFFPVWSPLADQRPIPRRRIIRAVDTAITRVGDLLVDNLDDPGAARNLFEPDLPPPIQRGALSVVVAIGMNDFNGFPRLQASQVPAAVPASKAVDFIVWAVEAGNREFWTLTDRMVGPQDIGMGWIPQPSTPPADGQSSLILTTCSNDCAIVDVPDPAFSGIPAEPGRLVTVRFTDPNPAGAPFRG